jgi:hypothetical protein
MLGAISDRKKRGRFYGKGYNIKYKSTPGLGESGGAVPSFTRQNEKGAHSGGRGGALMCPGQGGLPDPL